MHTSLRLIILVSVTEPRPSKHAKATRTLTHGDASGDRRAALIAIAAEMFAERGYKGTTVRQIGDAAGVFSGSLYHHFESKESIVDELLSDYLNQLLTSYRAIVAEQASPREKLAELVRAALKSLETHRAAIVVLQNERHELGKLPRFTYLKDRESEIRDVWLEVIQAGIAQGELRDDLDPAIMYRFARDAIWVAVRWFQLDGKLTLDDVTDHYVALLIDGIGAGARHRT